MMWYTYLATGNESFPQYLHPPSILTCISALEDHKCIPHVMSPRYRASDDRKVDLLMRRSDMSQCGFFCESKDSEHGLPSYFSSSLWKEHCLVAF